IFDDISTIDLSNFNSVIEEQKLRDFQNDLVRTSFLSKIVPGCSFHWWNHGGLYNLYPYNTKSQAKIFVLADKRNEILSKLQKEGLIEIEEWQKIEELPYFKGWNIYFTKKEDGTKYQWWKGLKKWDDTAKEWKEMIDISGNLITIDNLEEFLVSCSVQ
ncbi:MAG: hypothetical protein LBE13_09040, partial [Bacteroidales bacterium]|nr:hypothetical protein [Bacteroidales bacterium]